jgi:hypothetical protein
MKAYCKNCLSIQPSSFRSEIDAVTGSNYEDLCCDSCHFVVATIQERDAAAQPAPVQEPLGKLCVFDDADSEFGWSYDISGSAEQHKRMKELDGAMLYTTPPAQPAVPDAIGPNEDELPAYAAGWNDCRAEMLKGMK